MINDLNENFQKAKKTFEKGDYETSFTIFKSPEEQGDAESQSWLGHINQDGKGVTQDYKEGVKWYRLVAGQGYVQAQSDLGWMYDGGLRVSKDHKEAFKWWSVA